MTYPPPGPNQPPPYGYPPPVYQQHTVSKTGLPGWMHAVYAVAGIPTCGLAWIAWGVHWWVVQSRTKTQTTMQHTTCPPPPSYPPQPPNPPGAP